MSSRTMSASTSSPHIPVSGISFARALCIVRAKRSWYESKANFIRILQEPLDESAFEARYTEVHTTLSDLEKAYQTERATKYEWNKEQRELMLTPFVRVETGDKLRLLTRKAASSQTFGDNRVVVSDPANSFFGLHRLPLLFKALTQSEGEMDGATRQIHSRIVNFPFRAHLQDLEDKCHHLVEESDESAFIHPALDGLKKSAMEVQWLAAVRRNEIRANAFPGSSEDLSATASMDETPTLGKIRELYCKHRSLSEASLNEGMDSLELQQTKSIEKLHTACTKLGEIARDLERSYAIWGHEVRKQGLSQST